VTLDLETTGLDPRRDAIVSVAVVPFVGGEAVEGYETLVNPGRPIPPASTLIHGIADADVREAPFVGDVLPAIEAAIGAHVVVGHGVEFDLAILRREARAHRRPPLANAYLDTQRLAAACAPHWPDLGLDAVAAQLGVGVSGRHTARGDAIAAGHIFLSLLRRLEARGARTLAEAQWLQEHAPMPERPRN
jgi:DNA polymerase III epsilon subunit-like protein